MDPVLFRIRMNAGPLTLLTLLEESLDASRTTPEDCPYLVIIHTWALSYMKHIPQAPQTSRMHSAPPGASWPPMHDASALAHLSGLGPAAKTASATLLGKVNGRPAH